MESLLKSISRGGEELTLQRHALILKIWNKEEIPDGLRDVGPTVEITEESPFYPLQERSLQESS